MTLCIFLITGLPGEAELPLHKSGHMGPFTKMGRALLKQIQSVPSHSQSPTGDSLWNHQVQGTAFLSWIELQRFKDIPPNPSVIILKMGTDSWDLQRTFPRRFPLLSSQEPRWVSSTDIYQMLNKKPRFKASACLAWSHEVSNEKSNRGWLEQVLLSFEEDCSILFHPAASPRAIAEANTEGTEKHL